MLVSFKLSFLSFTFIFYIYIYITDSYIVKKPNYNWFTYSSTRTFPKFASKNNFFGPDVHRTPKSSPHDGRAPSARSDSLSTRVWTPSTANKPGERARPTLWANCSTTDAIRCRRCSWRCRRASPCNWAIIPAGCFSKWVKLNEHFF